MHSFRELAKRIDPVRPPVRLGGTPPPAYDQIPDLDEWHQGGRRAYTNATDLGLFHRKDKGIIQMHRGAASYRDVVERHTDPDTVTHRCLFYNAYLISPGSTEREGRAKDIGRMIGRNGYDVVGLCEVFNYNTEILDRASWGSHPEDTWESRTGPGHIYGHALTSGLFVLVGGEERRIVSSKRRAFETESTMIDTLANKGWLRTEISLGPGNIDLYVTHTNAGLPHLGAPSGDHDNEAARKGQLQEIFDEIVTRREKKPENISIVTGDLNVYLGDNHGINLWTRDFVSEYEGFIKRLDAIGMEDAWLTYGGKAGGTHAFWGEENTVCLLDSDCACHDYDEMNRGYKRDRLDYILIERPREEHSFNLDLSRIRRRPFPRTKPCGDLDHGEIDAEDYQYMSDHIGLDVTLIASSKTS